MERLRQLAYQDRARASREMGELSRELEPRERDRGDPEHEVDVARRAA